MGYDGSGERGFFMAERGGMYRFGVFDRFRIAIGIFFGRFRPCFGDAGVFDVIDVVEYHGLPVI